jgi:hypothetical protein
VEVTERLLADPGARGRLARAGEALYRERFDWPHTVRAIRDQNDARSG